MSFFIGVLTGIASVVALFFILALFVRKESTVQHSIVINKPAAEVFEYIRHLKNQDHYSKWVMTDPAMKKEFRGTDGTVGFVYGWDGNKKAGAGEQEIMHLVENETLDVEVRFQRPFKSVAQIFQTTVPVNENQTTVTWGMKSANPYPMNVMYLLIDGVLKKDLEVSLNTLKGILEKEETV